MAYNHGPWLSLLEALTSVPGAGAPAVIIELERAQKRMAELGVSRKLGADLLYPDGYVLHCASPQHRDAVLARRKAAWALWGILRELLAGGRAEAVGLREGIAARERIDPGVFREARIADLNLGHVRWESVRWRDVLIRFRQERADAAPEINPFANIKAVYRTKKGRPGIKESISNACAAYAAAWPGCMKEALKKAVFDWAIEPIWVDAAGSSSDKPEDETIRRHIREWLKNHPLKPRPI